MKKSTLTIIVIVVIISLFGGFYILHQNQKPTNGNS
jgi:hypothetical protein